MHKYEGLRGWRVKSSQTSVRAYLPGARWGRDIPYWLKCSAAAPWFLRARRSRSLRQASRQHSRTEISSAASRGGQGAREGDDLVAVLPADGQPLAAGAR